MRVRTTINFNLTKAPFDNQKVREAFVRLRPARPTSADALKDTEVKTLTWIPPGYLATTPTRSASTSTPAKGKAALAEAGFPEGKGLPEIKWSYNSNNPANQARVEYIIQMYQKSLGITIVPDPVEGTTLVNLRKSVETYLQILTGGWCADYPTSRTGSASTGTRAPLLAANTGYKNAAADKLMDAADIEVDPAKARGPVPAGAL
ncbi:MAG: ABC transporter substrate-binding protein [Kouleothrix sp.]